MLPTLCEAIVEDLYGLIARQIVNRLSTLGRMTASELAKSVKLNVSVVLRSLTSLVQLRLVQHWTETPSTKTFYSADLDAIYNQLRVGWMLAVQRQNLLADASPDFVQAATNVLSTLVIHGQLSIGTLTQLTQVDAATIKEMWRHNILFDVRPFDFWPPIDLKTHIMRSQYAKLVSEPAGLALSEAQKKLQVGNAAETELAQIQRRAKLPEDLTDANIVAANIERYLATGRRIELVKFAANRIGPVTAKVYEQALILSERNLTSLKQRRVPSPENNVTSQHIANLLSDEDLSIAFDSSPKIKEEEEEEDRPNKKQRLVNGSQGRHMPNQIELVTRHLQLLAGNPIRFLRRAGDRGGGEWFVPFDQVMDDLKRITCDQMVKASFGATAARLLRVVRDQVKVDEKFMSQVALLHARNIRHEITKLQLFGFVDLQEVPRGNDRAAGRNFYFWYHRPEKAYKRIVEELYSSMSGILAALASLRAENKTLLNKFNREDVRSDPEQYLTSSEKVDMGKYREKERVLVSQMMLIDSQVRIFKDY